jgi:glucose-6-phosphate 1-dehydrogenase
MNNCAIVILGATGDLTRRKLIPALYRLLANKKIEKFIIVGAALESITPEQLLESARPFISDINQDIWAQLHKLIYYQPVDFKDPGSFTVLAKKVKEWEAKHQLTGNRIIYLAAAAHFFCSITQLIAQSGLAQKCTKTSSPWQRMVYEKPFGHDLASAQEINTCIHEYFNEEQVYRVDHYLSKEVVSNISLVRFTNCVFEPLWNSLYIESVQIILCETVGVEGRGAYYDHYGAISDVMQNHMLELLALIAMEAPKKLTGEHIRERRVEVLKKVHVVDAIRGQYQGYLQEKNVNPQSTTETFAAAHLKIDNERWKGVPFYLKTGKYLNKKETVIHIKFKQVDCLLAHACPSESNYLTFRIYPDASFILTLNAKKPGLADQVIPVNMEFCHSCIFGSSTPEAYEVLFEEIMRGTQEVSVRFDEIEYAWRIIDSMKKIDLPLYTYQPGSSGPEQAEQFAKKHGIRWQL